MAGKVIARSASFAWSIVPAFIAISLARPASGADYSVAYALEAGGKTETGKVEGCNSSDSCLIKFRTMDATAHLSYFVQPADGDEIVLSMWGDSACCYFSDGKDSIKLDPAKRLHSLTIYAGHARRGNEFIKNEVVGTLYLSFAVSH